jgi:hypothetical protein
MPKFTGRLLPIVQTEAKLRQDQSLLPKEGILMRIRLFVPVLALAALTGSSASSAWAGSFFGPVCYGADYTYQYPNRSHNLFGCGPGCHCRAWHPLFKHRWFRRNQDAPVDGVPVDAMPGHSVPLVDGMPIEPVQTPAVLGPRTRPLTVVAPSPTLAMPAVQTRIVPVPAPMPAGSATAEPPPAEPSDKPPF